jgi:prevent-host-death family protein
MRTISSRELNQDVSAAKRAANEGPVVITDRGEPAYVLVTFEEFQRREAGGSTIIDRLSMPDDIEIEFEPSEIHFMAPEL